MQIVTEKTVREIATENPASIRVFEALGIDYCCGGRRNLSEACASAGIDTGRLLNLLAEAACDAEPPVSGEWVNKPLGDLIAHIVDTHHAFVRSETPRLEAMLSKVAAKHGPAHPEIPRIEHLFTAIGQELSTHMMKEEQVLFPYVAEMEKALANGEPLPPAFFGSVTRPIANMVAEHDDAGALLAQIRELSNGYTAPAEACPTFLGLYRGLNDFEHDLHHHIHLENNILFPRAVEMERTNASVAQNAHEQS